jgi:hypothetical protein
MIHVETSLLGFGCVIAGVLLFIFGNHTPESTMTAGTCIMAGLGLIRSADANKTVQKDDLQNLGIVGRKLGREVQANDAEKKDQG